MTDIGNEWNFATAEHEVECALHLARFCSRSGEYLSSPATADIDTFPLKQVGKSIYVLVEPA